MPLSTNKFVLSLSHLLVDCVLLLYFIIIILINGLYVRCQLRKCDWLACKRTLGVYNALITMDDLLQMQ